MFESLKSGKLEVRRCLNQLTVHCSRYRLPRPIALISVLVPLLLTIPVPYSVKPAFSSVDNSPIVRLLLAEDLHRVVVHGSSLMVEELENGSFRPVIRKMRMVGFGPASGGIQLEGSNATAAEFRIKPETGMIRYAGRLHRGYLTIRANRGKLMVVSHMPLESYLIGVVNGEIDSSWPMAAVKAQVVAARSYALYQMNTASPNYDLKTDVSDQVYAGFESEDERAEKAVAMTRGQALYGEDGLIQAFFHSSCGGSTSSAREIWGFGHGQLKGIYCGECEDAPYARWNVSPDPRELVRAVRTLYPRVDTVRSIGIHKRSMDGRVQTLFIETEKGQVLIDAGEFRKAMGYMRLPSTRFSLGKSDGRIVLTGEGYGHGVGLCQWGARGSALRGMDYKQILKKYYPGTEVRRAY